MVNATQEKALHKYHLTACPGHVCSDSQVSSSTPDPFTLRSSDSDRDSNFLQKTLVTGTAALLVFIAGCSSSEVHEPGNAISYDVARSNESVRQVAKPLTVMREQTQAEASIGDTVKSARVSAVTDALLSTRDAQVGPPAGEMPLLDPHFPPTKNTERYEHIDDNPVVLASREPTTTFSIDVDTGAYANVRRYLEAGQLPPADAVRIEELINYFNYDYEVPGEASTPFSVTTELAPSPWNKDRHLLHVGLQGYKPATGGGDRPAANLVFLLDVSGSMRAPYKLGLVKSAIKMLGRQLDAKDSVSIVVYAGASGVVLQPTPGSRYAEISSAVDQLQAGGSTNGESGIRLAYELAAQAFKPEGINRVILATDGDFNVGVANIETLKDLVARKRESGIALTTLGFGRGNYNDHLMENLADIGNGAYAYIDSISEARKVLVEELDSTLMIIAKDVKIQIEFNPANVSEYRLIGYVNRRLANEDFNNDRVDAGEIGAGHSVTALYEIALAGRGAGLHTPLRYASTSLLSSSEKSGSAKADELLELRLRYKPVIDGDGKMLPVQSSVMTQTSRLITQTVATQDVTESMAQASESFRFSAAIAAFGQQLRHGKHTGGFTLADTVELAESARGRDRYGYRAAFMQLVRLAESLFVASSPYGLHGNPQRDSG